MLNRAFKLSSNWQFFHQECERLKMVFARLHYPETLIKNTIRHFIEMRVTENVCSKQQVSEEQDARIRIVLPFKDQKSANVVRHQPSDLSRKIDAIVQHVRGSSWTSLAGVHGPKFCALRVPASGQ